MIISSTYDISLPQADGRLLVTETHVDDQKQDYLFVYLADDDSGVKQTMADRAVAIEQQQQDDAALSQAKQAAAQKIVAVLGSALAKGEIAAADLALADIAVVVP